MGEPAEALKTEPETDITFQGPFTSPVTADLVLTNTEKKKVAFKVKCTNNSKFRIKPVVGFLEPEESTTVKLTCQPFEYDSEKAPKERFVLFHLYADDEIKSAKTFWTSGSNGEGRRKNLPVIFKSGGTPEKEDVPEGSAPAEEGEQPAEGESPAPAEEAAA